MLRIPIRAEDQHFEIIGNTGNGKTTIIMQMLRQIQARGHSAILYDPACSLIDPSAPQQRSGVLGSLSLVADSFRLLTKETEVKSEWTAREWSEKRRGWIFLTSQPAEREALRPLHSLWIDMLVLRLLSAPKSEQHPVWFVLDELASLQKLPQLRTAITARD